MKKIKYKNKEYPSLRHFAKEFNLDYSLLSTRVKHLTLDECLESDSSGNPTLKKRKYEKLMDERIEKVGNLFKEGKKLSLEQLAELTGGYTATVSTFIYRVMSKCKIVVKKERMPNSQKYQYFMVNE